MRHLNDALVEAKAQAVAEYKRTLFGQLAEAERKANGLAHDIEKLQQKINAQYLTAPIAGTVQQLSVHTVGGVVTPAQMLLAVVPSTTKVEIEAMISNRDIGFVQAGQPAEIKVDTFNFTRYGLLHGEVLSVSHDAVVRDKAATDRGGEKPVASDGASGEAKVQELSFSTRVLLDQTRMKVDDKFVNLTPGMLTVEVKTGSRSVLGYLLSPIVKYRQEGLRER